MQLKKSSASQPRRSVFSKELDYVLACCFSPGSHNSVSGLNWQEVVRIIEGNKITGFVLNRQTKNSFDPEVLAQLDRSHRSQSLSGLYLAGESARLAGVATKHDIPVYFYKGVVWSQWLFGNVNTRAPGDIDVLTPASHLFKLINILKNAGYEINPFHKMLLDSPVPIQASFLKSDYHIPLTGSFSENSVPATLEVHWQIAYPRLCFDFDPSEFSPYATKILLLGQEIPVLQNEYQFLMLIVNHGGKENWNRLKYLADLSGYLDRYGDTTDWDLVARLAKVKGIYKLFRDALGILYKCGYELRSGLPEGNPDVNLESYQNQWFFLNSMPANSTWQYLKHAMASRDKSKKADILWAHLCFLLDFRLHRQKIEWYRKQAE